MRPALTAGISAKRLSQFATGVTVITTRLADGSFRGLTASSFNSVSLDPPLVLWSLGTGANSLPIFTGNSHYVINVLSAGQAHLAGASRRRSEDPFGTPNMSCRAPASRS
jgi:flavin reductase (DIM6/NTAB) family NADH-FMN oxidoreductase RutF